METSTALIFVIATLVLGSSHLPEQRPDDYTNLRDYLQRDSVEVRRAAVLVLTDAYLQASVPDMEVEERPESAGALLRGMRPIDLPVVFDHARELFRLHQPDFSGWRSQKASPFEQAMRIARLVPHVKGAEAFDYEKYIIESEEMITLAALCSMAAIYTDQHKAVLGRLASEESTKIAPLARRALEMYGRQIPQMERR